MKRFLFLLVPAAMVGGTIFFSSYSTGPAGSNQAVSGAPGEATCVQCHNEFPLNSGAGSVAINYNLGDNTYVEGDTYTLEINAGDAVLHSAFGFQISAVTKNGNETVGTFTAGNGSKIEVVGSKSFVEHSTPSGTGNWTIQWQAPSEDKGPIVFYATSVSATYPAGPQGDHVYSTQLEISNNSVGIQEPNAYYTASVFVYEGAQQLRINLNSPESGVTNFNVSDIQGRLIKSFSQSVNSGVNAINTEVSGLQKGTYFLTVNNGKNRSSFPFMVR